MNVCDFQPLLKQHSMGKCYHDAYNYMGLGTLRENRCHLTQATAASRNVA